MNLERTYAESDAWAAAARGFGERVHSRWQRLRGHRRGGWLAVFGPAAVGALAALGLLLAFEQVVRDGVLRGELGRQAWTQHADAAWRCQMPRGADQRRDCQAALDRAP